MKIIRNRILPLGRGMTAINLFGIIFAKRELSIVDRNHEYIHTLQQRELLWVGFYVLYLLEWCVRLIQTRSWLRAYFSISFEREAYRHQYDLQYARHRPRFGWRRFW